MRWDAVDLLDYRCLLQRCQKNTYSVVIDKSTADSIACADDRDVPIPYPVHSHPPGPCTSRRRMHPLVVLAINLALVSRPGAHWICLSYSDDRFGLSDWTKRPPWCKKRTPTPLSHTDRSCATGSMSCSAPKYPCMFKKHGNRTTAEASWGVGIVIACNGVPRRDCCSDGTQSGTALATPHP